MKWLKLHTENIDSTDNLDVNTDFTIKEFDINTNIKKEYSILTQFFILLSIQDQNNVTSLAINKRISDELIKEIIIHFDSRKVIYEKELPTEIMLSNPNNESVKIINSKEVNPIIKSLFNKNDDSIQNDSEWSQPKQYKIISEFIKKYKDEEFSKVVAFLKNTSPNSRVFLNINDWILHDTLQDSLLIRHLIHECNNVYLWIDEHKKITMIEFD
ncbi:hypothetical protein [Metabacillus fastidiosus]|uniref:hypothetical protein n=1 Tax=Metabacillus fastidiosus TaxID=1458 RepID=UPI003D2B406E